MHSPHGESNDGGRISPVLSYRCGGCGPFFRRSALFLFAATLATAVSAQNSDGVDCSDPLLATTYACSNQSQPSSQLPGQPGMPGGTSLPAMNTPGNGNNQPGNLPTNYSDIEQLTRQAGAPSTPLPPEPLTEFQKFVASTTGLVLPVYGADLFRRVPSTFAPVELAPVPADYVIGPGDELRIRIWGQVSIQSNLRVDRSGEIYLPQVGQIHGAGLTFSALDSHLREAVGRVYHNFDLSVDLGQIRSIQ